MDLNKEQKTALDKIGKWLDNGDQSFILGGYAGTGKTFLIQQLINSYSKKLFCATPTGKAASVLASRLNYSDVTTIHKLLYNPVSPSRLKLLQLLELLKKKPDDKELKKAIEVEQKLLEQKKVGFVLKDVVEVNKNSLVIIDEASMVSDKIYKDLLETKAKILFVGDPAQLPPVKGGGWFNKRKPDAMLYEVQRQALDNPIVHLSMAIREGAVKAADYQFENCKIIRKHDFNKDDWDTADQVITGKNITRHKLNRFHRKRLNYDGDLPVAGDKLICLKNELADDIFFINGVLCKAISDAWMEGDNWFVRLDYDGIKTKVKFYDYHCRLNYDSELSEAPWFARAALRELDYGYAITVHKAQGSEWDSVILVDDKMQAFQKEFRRRWLYTAITRAAKKLVWVQI